MRDTPWLAGLYAHRVRGRIATGPNTGKRIRTWGGSGESQEPEPSARRCANVDGFSVHANVSLPAHRRQQLENLCRYMLRPPTGCRAFGASFRRSPGVSDENTLARRVVGEFRKCPEFSSLLSWIPFRPCATFSLFFCMRSSPSSGLLNPVASAPLLPSPS